MAEPACHEAIPPLVQLRTGDSGMPHLLACPVQARKAQAGSEPPEAAGDSAGGAP
jgi:hypothetical protein